MENQTYVSILVATLRKKDSVLNELIILTDQQKEMIDKGDVSTDVFESFLSRKDSLIQELNRLDEGFEAIYERVKQELTTHGALFKDEIIEMQNLIGKITDKSVTLQTAEKRNQSSMEAFFAGRRKEIKDYHVNHRTVTSYYKSMANTHQGQSYFMDKKK